VRLEVRHVWRNHGAELGMIVYKVSECQSTSYNNFFQRKKPLSDDAFTIVASGKQEDRG
jgi:hypothetical protein